MFFNKTIKPLNQFAKKYPKEVSVFWATAEDKVFKSGPRKICGRQPLKKLQ